MSEALAYEIKDGRLTELITCNRCEGQGEWIEARVSSRWDTEPREEQVICPDCGGQGIIICEG